MNSWLVERLGFIRHIPEEGITRYAYDPRKPTLLPALQVLQNSSAALIRMPYEI